MPTQEKPEKSQTFGQKTLRKGTDIDHTSFVDFYGQKYCHWDSGWIFCSWVSVRWLAKSTLSHPTQSAETIIVSCPSKEFSGGSRRNLHVFSSRQFNCLVAIFIHSIFGNLRSNAWLIRISFNFKNRRTLKFFKIWCPLLEVLLSGYVCANNLCWQWNNKTKSGSN